MMTKKHYIHIAKLIKKWRLDGVKVQIGSSKVTMSFMPLDGFVTDLMYMLEEDNSNFNKSSFMKAIEAKEKETNAKKQ